MPTLDSKVAVTVTAPGGTTYFVGGQANSIGYFYDSDPGENFTVDEPGVWSVDVRIWHDGLCSGGQVATPYPSGDVLGSANGRYWFYVVPVGAQRLNILSPSPGFLSFPNGVSPIDIRGTVPGGLSNVSIDYTISMPGTILEHGTIATTTGTFSFSFDPVTLNAVFPNLDLLGRDTYQAGLSNTFSIGILLKGDDGNGTVHYANTITIQGEQVFVGGSFSRDWLELFLPSVLKGAQ
jgi:hypothetical protein